MKCARGWSVAMLLATASCLSAHPSSTSDARGTPPNHGPELRLDLRPPEHRGKIVDSMEEPNHPDTTVDGFPGWLSELPDSMKATVARADREVSVLVYVNKDAGPVDLSVHDTQGVIRKLGQRGDNRSPQSCSWDICDARRHRVAPGLYEVHASNRVGVRIGYLLVR